MSFDLGFDTSKDRNEVDNLTSSLKALQRALEQFGNTAVDALTRASAKSESAYAKMQRDMDGLAMSAKSSGQKIGQAMTDGIASGITQNTEKAKSLVRQQVAELQAYYEKHLQVGMQFKPGVLQALRKQGVSLAPADRLRLSDLVDVKGMETEATRVGDRLRKELALNRSRSATKMSEDDTRRLFGLPTRDEMKSFSAQIKAQMQEGMANATLRARGASRMSEDDTRRLFGLPSRDEMKSFAAQLKSQMQEGVVSANLRARGASKMSEDDTRRLFGLPTREEMKSFSAQLKAQMQEDVAAAQLRKEESLRSLKNQSKAMWADVAASEAKDIADAQAKKTNMLRSLKNQSKAMWTEVAQAEREGAAALKKASAEAAAAAAAAQAQIAAIAARPRAAGTAGLGLLGATTASSTSAADYGLNLGANSGSRSNSASGVRAVSTNALGLIVQPETVTALRTAKDEMRLFSVHTERLANHLTGAKAPTSHLTKEMNALHSAARGVASGFNAMWLTWGQLGPLLAGAAFSNLFVQAIKQGKEFESTLAVIDHLAEASGKELETLRQAALNLGTGQFGPNEVAKGLKVLALAGLDAKESLEAITPTLQFATVSELPLEQAAESIMGIASAFGYAAGDLSRVGDVIAKTAAVSMASVKDMTEAFKQSSTIAQKFKVSIEDQSLALGLLAQMGIRGSAAGTAVRNMYVELMGTSKQARRILEESLKVDIFNSATQSVKPLKQIFVELGQALSKYDFRTQMKILQDVGNERGMKALAAVMEAMAVQADKSGQNIGAFTSKLDEMQEELQKAAGFMAVASAGMAATTENIMKSVGNTLQGALIQAFDEISPYLVKFSLELRDAFRSEEFVNGIKDVIRFVGDLLKAIYENITTIGALAAAYLTWKVAAIAVITPIGLLAGGATALSTALTAKALAMGTVAASSAFMSAGLTTAANATLFLSRALNVVKLALGPLAILASAAAAAYMIYGDELTTAADKSEDAQARMQRDAQEAAGAARMKMQVTQESLDKEIERIETFLKNGGDEKKTQEELANAAVTASQMKVLANADETASIKLNSAALKEMEAAQIAAFGLGQDRKQRADALQKEADLLRAQAEAIKGAAQKEVDTQNASIERLRRLRVMEDELRASKSKRPLRPVGGEEYSDSKRSSNESLREKERLIKQNQRAFDEFITELEQKLDKEDKAVRAVVDAYADLLEAANNDADRLKSEADKQEEYARTLGMTREEVELLNIAQLETSAEAKLRRADLLDEIDWTGKLGDAYRDQAQEILRLAQAKRTTLSKQADIDARDAAIKAAKEAQDAWAKAAEQIEKDITDALMRGFESGKGFAKVLRDTLVNMFKTLVLRPVISAVVSPVAGAITGAFGLPGVANAASTGLSLYNAGSTVAGWLGLGASTGAGLTAAAGSGLSLAAAGSGLGISASTGAGLGLAASTGGGLGISASSAGAASLGAGASGSALMAAAPWLLGGLAVVSLLRSLDKSGTFATGGAARFSASGGVTTASADELRVGNALGTGFADSVIRGDQATQAAVAMSQTIAGILDATAVSFGRTAGYEITTAFASDSVDGAWGSLIVRLGDRVVKDWGSDRTSRWAPREFANGEAGAKEYAAAVAKDVRDYLLTQTPDWADVMLNALGDAPTLETLSAVVAQINAAAAALEGMGRASKAFAGLSSTALSALMKAMGGAEAAAATLSNYYENFYTEEERTTLATARLTAQLQELGLKLPETREAFRGLVDAALAAGNTSLAASLLNLSGAFASIKPAAESAAESVKDKGATALSNLRNAIDREKAQWQKAAEAAQTLRDEVQGLFDLLADNIRELRAEAAGPTATAQQGRAFIRQALSAAQAGAGLPDQGDLSSAIGAARGGLGMENFASVADQRFAAAELAGELEGLQKFAGDQLTMAEAMLQNAESQLNRLDDTLEYWERQVELAQGGIDATMTVEQAVRDLLEFMKDPTGKGKDKDKNPNGRDLQMGGNNSGDAYRSLTEGPPRIYTRDANGNNGSFLDTANWAQVGGRWVNISGQTMANQEDYWAARLQHAYDSPAADMKDTWQQLTSSMFAGDASRLIAAARGAGLSENVIASYVHEFMPKYAVGTPFVPKDGPAFLHRGEMVVPAAYNPAVHGHKTDQATRQELAAQRQELADIRVLMTQMVRNTHRAAEALNGNAEAHMVVETLT